MNTIIESFNKIKLNIKSVKPIQKVNVIAVSKTFSLERESKTSYDWQASEQ